VKYTGLIFDSTTEPILHVPEYKVGKAIAMIDYVLGQHKRISRPSLAVVAGVLESMVEATPSRVGHTYLRHLHTVLYPVDWDGSDLPFYSFTSSLDDRSIKDLNLWKWLLIRNEGQRARATKSGILIPSFGDGSGTGTGGTIRYHNDADFEMWMGVWSPVCTTFHQTGRRHGPCTRLFSALMTNTPAQFARSDFFLFNRQHDYALHCRASTSWSRLLRSWKSTGNCAQSDILVLQLLLKALMV
jgi:hypothetical protein